MGRNRRLREQRNRSDDIFKDYIDGVKEISEVNAAFNARYVSEIPDNDSSMSCGMGMRR